VVRDLTRLFLISYKCCHKQVVEIDWFGNKFCIGLLQARVLDCFLMEGVKVLYRVAIAILLSFSKACSSDSKWSNLLETSGLDSAISKFCSDIATTVSNFSSLVYLT
jgi:hypothetical protein